MFILFLFVYLLLFMMILFSTQAQPALERYEAVVALLQAKGEDVPREMWNNIGLLHQLIHADTDRTRAEQYGLFFLSLS
jgi:hypothetical protein